MSRHMTARSIAFAALAAAFAPLCWHLLGIPAGVDASLAFFAPAFRHPAASSIAWVWIGLVALYARGLAGGNAPKARRRSAGAALGVAAAGATAFWLAGPTMGVLCALALGLAVIRISTGQNRANARGILLEAALGMGSLWLARWLTHSFGPGPLAFAAGVWGFFLVQSLFFALAPAPRVRDHLESGDAFDAARRRLESLLAGDVP